MTHPNLEMIINFYVVYFKTDGKWVKKDTYHIRRDAELAVDALFEAGYEAKLEIISYGY